VDEKAFRKGHKYLTLVNDLTGNRVLYVAEDREQRCTPPPFQLGTRECPEREVDDNAPVVKEFLELCGCGSAVMSQQIGLAANVDGEAKAEYAKLQ
jgi:hypothetical protein